MPWTVRTPQGSLDFETLGDVARAYRNGLVSPEDEVREHGRETWRRADSIPALRSARPTPTRGLPRSMLAGVVLPVALALFALFLMAKGEWLFALLIAVGVSLFMMRMTRRTAGPRRTFHRTTRAG